MGFNECIESCFECANASWICADASLHDQERSQLRFCIDLCLSTAEICAGTARALARGTDKETIIVCLKKCIDTCHRMYLECAKFSDRLEHCQIGARCAKECSKACSDCLDGLRSNSGHLCPDLAPGPVFQ